MLFLVTISECFIFTLLYLAYNTLEQNNQSLSHAYSQIDAAYQPQPSVTLFYDSCPTNARQQQQQPQNYHLTPNLARRFDANNKHLLNPTYEEISLDDTRYHDRREDFLETRHQSQNQILETTPRLSIDSVCSCEMSSAIKCDAGACSGGSAGGGDDAGSSGLSNEVPPDHGGIIYLVFGIC